MPAQAHIRNYRFTSDGRTVYAEYGQFTEKWFGLYLPLAGRSILLGVIYLGAIAISQTLFAAVVGCVTSIIVAWLFNHYAPIPVPKEEVSKKLWIAEGNEKTAHGLNKKLYSDPFGESLQEILMIRETANPVHGEAYTRMIDAVSSALREAYESDKLTETFEKLREEIKDIDSEILLYEQQDYS